MPLLSAGVATSPRSPGAVRMTVSSRFAFLWFAGGVNHAKDMSGFGYWVRQTVVEGVGRGGSCARLAVAEPDARGCVTRASRAAVWAADGPARPTKVGEYNPSDPSVDLFAALDKGDIAVQLVFKDSNAMSRAHREQDRPSAECEVAGCFRRRVRAGATARRRQQE